MTRAERAEHALLGVAARYLKANGWAPRTIGGARAVARGAKEENFSLLLDFTIRLPKPPRRPAVPR
ncbi:MAG: hypothetical protein M3167_06085 [Acidobacteriota bacterium]|nr:hypothetical protein [Acidobacteriota bacterium]